MDNSHSQVALAKKALDLHQQRVNPQLNADGVLSYSIKGLSLATGWSRSRIYELINAGELVALKDGKRTIITAESARRRIESLPTYTPKSAA